VSRNQLTALPPELSALRKLRLLHAAGNRLSTLPHTFYSLVSLKDLNLNENQFQVFPEPSYLSNIRILSMTHNQIQELPADMRPLGMLRELDLSDNQLTSISKGISLFRSLA